MKMWMEAIFPIGYFKRTNSPDNAIGFYQPLPALSFHSFVCAAVILSNKSAKSSPL